MTKLSLSEIAARQPPSDHHRRQNDSDGTPKIRLTFAVAMQIIAWIVGVLMVYGAMDKRVSVIEARQTISDSRLERMERKIDQVLEGMRRP